MSAAYRPSVKSVRAVQFDSGDWAAAAEFAGMDFDKSGNACAVLSAPGEVWRELEHGDWVVRYPTGQLRIYGRDEFLEFFEPVSIEGGGPEFAAVPGGAP